MSGFTLIELVTILLVFGIVVALAYPALQASLTDARLRAAASAVSTAFQFAQLSAMSTGRPYRVTVDADADTVVVATLAPTYLAAVDAAVQAPGTSSVAEAVIDAGDQYQSAGDPTNPGTDYQVALGSDPRYVNADIVSASFAGSSAVVFEGLGVPSAGGSALIAYGGRQIQVSIEPVTGRVTLTE